MVKMSRRQMLLIEVLLRRLFFYCVWWSGIWESSLCGCLTNTTRSDHIIGRDWEGEKEGERCTTPDNNKMSCWRANIITTFVVAATKTGNLLGGTSTWTYRGMDGWMCPEPEKNRV